MRTIVGLALATASALACAACLGAAEANPETGAAIEGSITFEGKPPARAKLDRRSDPFCAKTTAYDESIVVGKNGGLRDVFVQIQGKGLSAKPPSAPAVIDQKACTYHPRVLGVVDGQPIEIRNNDKTLHNVHAYLDGSTEFNLAQPDGARPIERTIEDASGVLELKCDVHPWMKSYAVLVDHSHFAVTAADGSFAITGVPPGSYTLTAWHPELGTRTAKVTVAKGKTVRQDLSFAAK